MRLGRRKVSDDDGTSHRILVAGSDGVWFDVRTAARLRTERRGGSQSASRRLAEALVPESMHEALAAGEEFTELLARVLQERPEGALVAEPMLTNALDPVSYRDFMVFQEHFSFGYRWQGKPVPDVMYELPISYAGDPRSFIGPEDVIPWPSYTQRLDYELELGIVIGKAGTDLTPDNALDHVLGLTILNDVSARDIQAREMTGGLGPSKGKHFACVTGPVIVTLDELPATGLGMRTRVNGQTWCETTSAEMVWSIAEIVAWASQGELLRPGALLGSGTCNGGSTVEIDRRLSPGDVIELEIDMLGTLRNRLGYPSEPNWSPTPRDRDDDGRASTLHFIT